MNFASIKAATVAIARVHNIDRRIFEIGGSGVCIDPCGIILTCEHVISAFMTVPIPEQVKGVAKSSEPKRFESGPVIVPHAIFYKVDVRGRLTAFPCRVDQILSSTVQDIGRIRVLPHTALPKGYPAEALRLSSESGGCPARADDFSVHHAARTSRRIS